MIKYVYVAGPYTKGDVKINIATAVRIGDSLMKAGLIPFIPHLTHLWAEVTEEKWDYEDWLQYDFKWLSKCDAVLRFPGFSPGADREVTLAKDLKIPVFFSLDELLAKEGKDIPDELRW